MARRTVLLLLTFIILIALPLVTEPAQGAPGNEPGASDLYILNGGVMAQSDAGFVYSGAAGVYIESDGVTKRLSDDSGANLNVIGGYVYYTLESGAVRRVSVTGGEPETVYAHSRSIEQLYAYADGSLRFLSGGRVYLKPAGADKAERISELTGVLGLIPTSYGDILMLGEVFDYTLYVNGAPVLEGVTGCYTDSGYLAVSKDFENYQISLSRLFSGFDPDRDLDGFEIHGTAGLADALPAHDEEHSCAVCEANAGLAELASVRQDTFDISLLDLTSPEVSDGQRNIVKRARQQHEIVWTPLADRYQWRYNGVFQAGVTYTGLPYGQPVYSDGAYVPWYVSLSTYIAAVENNTSKFYTSYSSYNAIAPAYSCDCSSFVSWAWQTKERKTTYSLPDVATRIGTDLYSLQIGDALNDVSSHVALVANVLYDDEGKIKTIIVLEQTPPKTKRTAYGEGGTQTLAYFQSYYFNRGYVIYRNPARDNVVYTHDCAVPIDGDYCPNCKAAAPMPASEGLIGGKKITLTHADSTAVIYYTTDGSDPMTNGTLYTAPITVTQNVKLRAAASTDTFAAGRVLEYTVSIPKAQTPTHELVSGAEWNGKVTRGAKISLKSADSGVTLYYTTDGSEPSAESAVYSSPITINSDMTVKVFARGLGYSDSDIAVFSFTVGKTFEIQATSGAGGEILPGGTVEALESSDLTFLITPDKSYIVESVYLDGASVGFTSSGGQYSYTLKNISAAHTVSVSFKKVSQLPFTDVAVDKWYYDAVYSVYTRGFITGVTDTTYVPDGNMTRGMFVTLLGRIAGVPTSLTAGVGIVTGSGVNLRSGPGTDTEVLTVCAKYAAVQVLGKSGDWYNVRKGTVTGYIRGDYIKAYNGVFTDVKSTQYYAASVEWAYLVGIVSGTSDTTFSPDANITREQMCAIFVNYASKFGLTIPATKDKTLFPDNAEISGYAVNAVYAMQQAGVVSGTDDGTFKPKKTATRAEVAKLISDFLIVMGL